MDILHKRAKIYGNFSDIAKRSKEFKRLLGEEVQKDEVIYEAMEIYFEIFRVE